MEIDIGTGIDEEPYTELGSTLPDAFDLGGEHLRSILAVLDVDANWPGC